MAFDEVIWFRPLFFIIIFGLIPIIACGQDATGEFTGAGRGGLDIRRINEKELSAKLEGKNRLGLGFHLVDLRNEVDYLKGFIPGSINIPSKKLPFLAEKIFSKSDEIVFYSHSKTDFVGTNAIVFMRNKGFANCYIFAGGIKAWRGLIEKGIGK